MPGRLRGIAGLAALLLLIAGSVVVMALTGQVAGASTPAAPASGATVTGTDAGAQGRTLYLQSCASCHGPDGRGTANGPDITAAGAAGADFYLRTGRMPLSGPGQPNTRVTPVLSQPDIQALVGYVASLGKGPQIPQVSTSTDLGRGWSLFIQNCAACHGAAAGGGAIGGGFVAPPLQQATPVEIAEAMRVGPGVMPVFKFSQQDQDAIVAYVLQLRNGPSPGGLSLAGLGPVPEGFVAVVVGMGLLLLIARRIEPPKRPGEPPPAEPERRA